MRCYLSHGVRNRPVFCPAVLGKNAIEVAGFTRIPFAVTAAGRTPRRSPGSISGMRQTLSMSARITNRRIMPRSSMVSAVSCRLAAKRSYWTGAVAMRLRRTNWRRRAEHCCSTTAPMSRVAGSFRASLITRKIRVIDDAALDAMASASIDLIIVNSVAQYLSRQQFNNALRHFHALLKPDGKLLLGDIIEPDTLLIGHVTAFTQFAWQNDFFVAAIFGLVRNFISPYRKLRRDAGYACYSETEILLILKGEGFVGERLMSNIVVSQLRSSYLARKQDAT